METQLILDDKSLWMKSVSKADKSRVRTEIFQVLSYPKNTGMFCARNDHHCPYSALLPPVIVGRNMSPFFQHQKHLQDHSSCGDGLDKTQRGCSPSKWDQTSSQKEQRDLFAMKSLGWPLGDVPGSPTSDLSRDDMRAARTEFSKRKTSRCWYQSECAIRSWESPHVTHPCSPHREEGSAGVHYVRGKTPAHENQQQ